ncbi:MAG: pyridoxal phosphate-dependent aminotransferase [Acidobacteria bacterium]|nr:pyridoxal phosphate-dependent aminotransferase [Acidobacteriota bacterium]MBI3422099.1 pyridoxal phosphate-dependent aminotransferase [Acidobacteriota bacterium]
MNPAQNATRSNPQPTILSRRSFGRAAALLTAGAALPWYSEANLAYAQLSKTGPIPADAVKINANENPLGPCPEAIEAMTKALKGGGRYSYELTDEFAKTLADQEDLDADYVLPFPGSSDPLHRVTLAYTSKEKPLVMGDPGYEAPTRAAQFIGAKVIKVPLTEKTAYHDVKAMVKAAHENKAGVIYICNPNNPTGTITPRADIAWAIANKPEGCVILLDEAYIHLSDEAFASDFVSMDKDVIILRTFSKIYGMAGLRAGAAIARPDLLAKLKNYGAGALPVTGMVAATASLKAKTLVAERRKLIKDVREDVFSFLDKNGFAYLPSVSNCFMLDVKMPAKRFMKAMQKEKIYVGRAWAVWPTHSRITIGTKEEMAKFKTALVKVMNSGGSVAQNVGSVTGGYD